MTLTILMPVKNEGLHLPIILKILDAVVDVPHEILVVYDIVDDTSVPIVQTLQSQHPLVHLVYNTLGPGVGNAIRAGVRQARGEYVLIFAVDDTGPVLAIDEMLRLMESGCDLVSCTRYAKGGRRLGGSLLGGLLSRFSNALFRGLTGTVLTDATTGIKMVRRTALEGLLLETKTGGWAVAFELAVKAQAAGWRVAEVPIISIDRLFGGQSTFALGSWVREYWKWFLWGVWHLRQDGRTRSYPLTVRVPSDDGPS